MLSTMKPRREGKGGRLVAVERKTAEDKYSIKNLIFMPSRPNYVIPVDTEGHKVYFCIDCGDRFICESSYNFHVNRRSVKITYTCRNCSKTMVYMNRCNLLSHIRSHVFKTATIHLMDLKVEPLPVEDMVFGLFHLNEPLTIDEVIKAEESRKKKLGLPYTLQDSGNDLGTTNTNTSGMAILADNSDNNCPKKRKRKIKCIECGTLVPFEETISKTRAKHYMTPGPTETECPICHYKLPSQCALDAHIRSHQNVGSNCICPECGEYIHKYHTCPGYSQIRNSAQSYCLIEECGIIETMKYHNHHIQNHIKSVYKCSLCHMACLTEAGIHTHLVSKHPGHPLDGSDVSIFYQCGFCPGRLVLKECLSSHIDTHKAVLKAAYPCWKCGIIKDTVSTLLEHLSSCSDREEQTREFTENRQLYRVVKQCKTCNRKVTYKCDYSEITDLPNICPNKCKSQPVMNTIFENVHSINKQPENQEMDRDENKIIKCPICKITLNTAWNHIKDHFSECHQKHHCIDVNLKLKRLEEDQINMKNVNTRKRKRGRNRADRTKARKRQRSIPMTVTETTNEKKDTCDKYTCRKCGDISSKTTESFKSHILTHRDPSTAYQCMECGFCFVVKPSFSTHLFVAHGIKDAEHYIATNECYNDDAFKGNNAFAGFPEEPLKENQCKICREEFNSEDQLGKHFRVHGMAFLMTKKIKKQ